MTKAKENRGFSNFGFSTILLSFVMICVVTFSALSLVTAYSDYKLSKRTADRNQSFYAAQERAYEKLAALDALLAESCLSAGDEASYYTNLEETLKAYGTFAETSAGCTLTFQEPIAEDQYLAVTLLLHYPQKGSDTFYEIAEWKSVYTVSIPEDETLHLIQ